MRWGDETKNRDCRLKYRPAMLKEIGLMPFFRLLKDHAKVKTNAPSPPEGVMSYYEVNFIEMRYHWVVWWKKRITTPDQSS